MNMYVYPKNHKSEVERELRMVPLKMKKFEISWNYNANYDGKLDYLRFICDLFLDIFVHGKYLNCIKHIQSGLNQNNINNDNPSFIEFQGQKPYFSLF